MVFAKIFILHIILIIGSVFFSKTLFSMEAGFIQLIAPLDEPRGLCVDIRGHRDRVNVTRPLVLHTCKYDIWNLDEKFSLKDFKAGLLKMPEYQLCAQPDLNNKIKEIRLEKCKKEIAVWHFDNARLKPIAKPNLCLTAGPGPSKLTRGGKRLPSRHVARRLFLMPCSQKYNERQKWRLKVPR